MAEARKKDWSEEVIKEVASDLDLGVSIFVPIMGGETHLLPREQDIHYADEDQFQIAIDAIKLNPKGYIQVDPPESREQYFWMKDFATRHTSGKRQDQLLDTLSRKQAFSHFRDKVVDLGISKEWDAYTAQCYIEHTRMRLNNPSPHHHTWLGSSGSGGFYGYSGEEE